jgi:hypothetical protein
MLEAVEPRRLLSVGGGIAGSGWVGQYFPNPGLSGQPSFARPDIRVDFDWGSTGSVSGSIVPAEASFPTDGFSVRWSATLLPRFSETYLFSISADEGVVLRIKAQGSSTWTTVIDQWASTSQATHNGSFSLVRGTKYDVQLDYRDLAGEGNVQLKWSSPSTPSEVLEVASEVGINTATYGPEMWADAMKSGRREWDRVGGGRAGVDAAGWPTEDATNIVWEGQTRKPGAPGVSGTFALQFKGRAAVSISFNAARFIANGTDYGVTLPAGVGYDPATNTTNATVVIPQHLGICFLNFTQTRRTSMSSLNTGVTDVKFMRPIAPGSSTPHAFGELYHRPALSALSHFSAHRWILNGDTDSTWSSRTRPGGSSTAATGSQPQWEYQIQLANQTGKDLYISTPINADADYLTKLAQLIRYGSDGNLPYTSQEANPVYPPLNSNLRVYVERSNEVWNWRFDFPQSYTNQNQAQQAVTGNTSDGQIINYDGTGVNPWRWHALQTKKISDLFASIWGSSAINDRVRVLLEYQYDDAQGTASNQLEFLDNYFNNGDGNHVVTPRPVSTYIFGAGGASYYGAANPRGEQTDVTVANHSFEAVAVAAGQALAPSGSGITFSGNAGIFRTPTRTNAWTIGSGSSSQAPVNASYGVSFTVGAQPVAVYELGRQVYSGNGQKHGLRILRASDRLSVADAEVDTAGAASGSSVFERLSHAAILLPNTTYYLLSDEFAGGDTFGNASTPAASVSGLTINGAIRATWGDPSWDVGSWSFTNVGPGSFAFAGVQLRVVTAQLTNAEGSLGYVPLPDHGDQAAYFGGTGSFSFPVTFTEAGIYALEFEAAAKYGWDAATSQVVWDANDFDIYVGSTKATPAYPGGPQPWVGEEPFGFRYLWSKDQRDLLPYGSASFAIPAPGTYTVRFQGTRQADIYTFIDRIRVMSQDRVFTDGIPTRGEATGQVGINEYTQQLANQARHALVFGTRAVSYEGGWSLGGDFDALPIQAFAKYTDPRAAIAQRDALNAWARTGGSLNTLGTYDLFPGHQISNAGSYPLMQGTFDFLSELPPEPDFGLAVPAVLNPSASVLSRNATAGGRLDAYGWLSWTIVVPQTGTYRLSLDASAGGMAKLTVNDRNVLFNGPSGSAAPATTTLTKGIHTVRVRAGSTEAFDVRSLTVEAVGAPASPVLTSLADANAAVNLAWEPVPGATGYRVLWGTAPGLRSNMLDAGPNLYTTVSGLSSDQTYYFVVVAYNSLGQSLPSVERGVNLLVDGQIGNIAAFEFTGLRGDELEGPVTSATSRVVVSPVTRGPGLEASDAYVWLSFINNTLTSVPTGNFNLWTYADSLAREGFYELTVTPEPGQTLSISELSFIAYWQNFDPNNPSGAHVRWRVGGGAFSSGVQASGTGSSTEYDVQLGSVAALQDITQAVTFRIYMWGVGGYSFLGLGGNGSDVVVRGSMQSIDSVAPVVASSAFKFEAAPNAVELVFSEDIGSTLAMSDLILRDLTQNTVVPASALVLSYDPALRRATLIYSTGVLPDGNYRLELAAGSVADAAGNVLASDHQLNFHVLAGDINRDATVNFSDLLILAQNYGTSGRIFSEGNLDYDPAGEVGFGDLLILAQHYTRSLLPAGVSPLARSRRRSVLASIE